ncbi:Nuclear hormone receptor family member nhr-150 [Caenorhabditis elegans]|uniref:Nuclear hormone receptor family member nhr-150 n=1 Tax=Caenorhabditis elegans TaxID=6239 RepID=NH150_CAEEL|nr:Nuclear hormone receptor family member nhr-150 [Caenorhabditis elegans]O17573.1 RecName: Full=Nuclear hormone receptor family member nhr-150 [Caenorhabditis elegans]CAB03850.1 Nuclear hormone receptor family member nhr-150 [Caenorhabditis elegans]|eukprot:NP_506854.1 Nuclear hormone receptor family member nhr-150 [Caenorhabditis elegans]
MCQVCGAAEADLHFGGISCRACAAFFRRFFLSKKQSKKCTCKTRILDSHPCRSCRILKCFEAGMTSKKIQSGRDKTSTKAISCISTESTSNSLSARIIPRSSLNIHGAVHLWQEFENTRACKKGTKRNALIVSTSSAGDMDSTWKMVINLFSSLGELEIKDKTALLRNFMPKFIQIDSVPYFAANIDVFKNIGRDEYESSIIDFYDGVLPETNTISKKDTIRIFEPYWNFYTNKVILPIALMKLEGPEFMALVWLLFFDNGYTNLSDKCREACRNIKKVILRELRSYQIDRNFDRNRFFEILEALQLVERGEKKFMEEMVICELLNIKIDPGFMEIIRESKL